MGSMSLGLFLCMLALVNNSFASGVNVYDGFETGTLSNIWRRTKFVPGAVEIQSKIVRSGKSAAKITVHQGDLAELGGQESLPSERAELMEQPNLWAIEDVTYAYSFSMFIPQDFPIVPTRLVIAQWKQRCPQERCDPGNPVIAVRYIAGELLVTHKVGPEKTVLYRTKEDIRNKWLDFRFQIRFTRHQSGQVKAWLNDKALVDYKGINAYPEQGGYPSRNHFYFKMGLYRDRMPEPMTLYVDEYRKEELSGGGP